MLLAYQDVIPITANSGDKIAFSSPVLNFFYRKMLYFVSNKKLKHEKRGIILPFLNDNSIVFSKKEGQQFN